MTAILYLFILLEYRVFSIDFNILIIITNSIILHPNIIILYTHLLSALEHLRTLILPIFYSTHYGWLLLAYSWNIVYYFLCCTSIIILFIYRYVLLLALCQLLLMIIYASNRLFLEILSILFLLDYSLLLIFGHVIENLPLVASPMAIIYLCTMSRSLIYIIILYLRI